MIDIDDIRSAHIKMHRLTGMDDAYTFYHDETNNIKKLRIKTGGFNVAEPGVFVLGGVVHPGTPRDLDIETLRADMRIQKSAKEIKLEHVAKGRFLDVLRSTKLTVFLRWLSENDLRLHYHALDPVYWGIVDILDSILYRLGDPHLAQAHIFLKADLSALLRANLSDTAALFYKYNYPALSAAHRAPFIDDLLALVERDQDSLPDYNSMMLKGALQRARRLPSFDFIEGYTAHELLGTFALFYLTRIAVFKHAFHILDMEDTVRDEMIALAPSSNGVPVENYKFCDSKSETGIQVSDVIVGVLGKMYTYLVETPRDQVLTDQAALSGPSKTNADLLRDLIDEANVANTAFLNHVMSNSDVDKMNLFLGISRS
ncbi:DUF3800 domain-containing protein [uncultured Hyphomonas sp.]|uniref:DUF3800 domain-containing protein n=1 Tax=uncultured Hyphomonas sp. TaxID=225298 RepID=UPI000C53DA4E|nr:hypothetical protein [Hyphomonadaceae bacterium]MBA29702.1 hypothetical protein [Hyphomonadaceae bacterium]|tara:strand:- start:63119 stop:64234 length:1116 start_codon:yes stop_codon:yes gene_type:complete